MNDSLPSGEGVGGPVRGQGWLAPAGQVGEGIRTAGRAWRGGYFSVCVCGGAVCGLGND